MNFILSRLLSVAAVGVAEAWPRARRLAGLLCCLLPLFGCILVGHPAIAQAPPAAQSSASASAAAANPSAQAIEKLSSWLSAIDPYLPKEKVQSKLIVYGSGSMDGLMHAWADNFREFHGQASFEISGLPEDSAIERLAKEPGSIWMVSRPIAISELDQLKNRGVKQPVAFEVAREALGVFVHPSNPVASIDAEQLKAIFTPASTTTITWRQLGAAEPLAGKSIQVVGRNPGSGTRKFLESSLFGKPMVVGKEVRSNAAVVQAIKDQPNSIGICGLKCGATVARPLQLRSGNQLIASDDLAILSGQYPLIRPLSIVVNMDDGSSNTPNMEFIRYILSQSGQTENVLAGFFPIDLPLLRAEVQRLGQAAQPVSR